MAKDNKITESADGIVELDKELETAGHAALGAPTVVRAREVLHQWIDDMKGVVVNPALGRVTVIDQNGGSSSIASASLAYKIGRASCRERVCQYVKISVVALSLKKKKIHTTKQ